jgi:hypothetical protein
MSCYFRHLKEIFDEAGIVVMPNNRNQIDQAIHQVVGVTQRMPSSLENVEAADNGR